MRTGGLQVIVYPIGTSGQTLILSNSVVEHLCRNRQLRWYHREAGGQLFARFQGTQILVEEATGPRSTDTRTRCSYIPDRKAEQAEILLHHAQGLHYVGDWHTHPETIPVSSVLDIQSISDCFAKSAHQLNGFVLIIVGRSEPPPGFHVSINNDQLQYVLNNEN